ncbi:MAG: SDR family NAD(P)-dependent oxidoreductase [Ginsengibacter sp.]
MKRTVFITGATSGIGLACSQRFAANGDNLIINGRRTNRLEELKSSLEKQFSVKVHISAFDVQDKQAVFSAIDNAAIEFNNVDILINNAGLALGKDFFEEADMDDWETMIKTNVNGLLYVSRAVIPFMIKRNKGHIINIGSVAGIEVYEKGNVYCATKFAVDAISKSMRIDLLRYNIKVTAIHPGAVETEFSLVRFKGDAETAGKVYEGFTPLYANDIAETIFFCSSLAPAVCINELVITPTAQANSIYIKRVLYKPGLSEQGFV